MNIKNRQKAILRFLIKDLDYVINNNDLEQILLAVNDAIVKYGFTENYEHLNVIGKKLDKLYEDILEQNKQ
ncbi:MAG: hypothetical protein IKL18_06290 [Oscillospiraceae bacterium]|nr:hypothetical protein [Oscillospiraceae bacterium]